MSIVEEANNWGHQALNPRDPRLPVEVLRQQDVVVGTNTGGVSAIQFNIRLISVQLRKSSQVYALASISVSHDSTTALPVRVSTSGFELGGTQGSKRWGLDSTAVVDGVRVPARAFGPIRNILLGTPTGNVSAAITVQKDNETSITLLAEIAVFRFLPTVFQSGGPLFPQGEY